MAIMTLRTLVAGLFALLALNARAGDFSDMPAARAFIDRMVEVHGLDRAEVTALIGEARRKDSILEAISRPAEAKPWHEYRPIFVNRARIDGGLAYWDTHQALLERVAERLQVDPAYIVAIVGVETRYGGHAGRFRVLDALATLGFAYPPRSAFFTGELEQFLLLAREERLDPREALGSYAGAMGHGQFIPSSYRRYAIDFDGDGRRDLWHSDADILGSVANYLKVHGWEYRGPVAVRARLEGEPPAGLLAAGPKPHLPAARLAEWGLVPATPLEDERPVGLLELAGADGPEYWITCNNFQVITRYNRSPLYAMAVHQLAQAIAAQRRDRGTFED